MSSSEHVHNSRLNVFAGKLRCKAEFTGFCTDIEEPEFRRIWRDLLRDHPGSRSQPVIGHDLWVWSLQTLNSGLSDIYGVLVADRDAARN